MSPKHYGRQISAVTWLFLSILAPYTQQENINRVQLSEARVAFSLRSCGEKCFLSIGPMAHNCGRWHVQTNGYYMHASVVFHGAVLWRKYYAPDYTPLIPLALQLLQQNPPTLELSLTTGWSHYVGPTLCHHWRHLWSNCHCMCSSYAGNVCCLCCALCKGEKGDVPRRSTHCNILQVQW